MRRFFLIILLLIIGALGFAEDNNEMVKNFFAKGNYIQIINQFPDWDSKEDNTYIYYNYYINKTQIERICIYNDAIYIQTVLEKKRYEYKDFKVTSDKMGNIIITDTRLQWILVSVWKFFCKWDILR